MELSEFISSTLLGIVNGILEARSKCTDALIYPVATNSLPDTPRIKRDEGYLYLSPVEFDIALTSEQSGGTTGKIGVLFANLGAGVKGESKNMDSQINRIKFSIPIAVPPEAQGTSPERRQFAPST